MIRSLVYFVAIFFALILIVPVIWIALNDFNDAIQGTPTMPSVAKTELSTQTTKLQMVMDYAILIVFFAGLVGMIALAWALPTNSMTAFVILLVIGLVGLLCGFLSNAYADISAGTDTYAIAAGSFPISAFIANNYLLLMLFAGIVTFVVFYAKPNPEGAFG